MIHPLKTNFHSLLSFIVITNHSQSLVGQVGDDPDPVIYMRSYICAVLKFVLLKILNEEFLLKRLVLLRYFSIC